MPFFPLRVAIVCVLVLISCACLSHSHTGAHAHQRPQKRLRLVCLLLLSPSPCVSLILFPLSCKSISPIVWVFSRLLKAFLFFPFRSSPFSKKVKCLTSPLPTRSPNSIISQRVSRLESDSSRFRL
uniref:Secreted protein n=1 Tax=Echinococcus granulosus TaxID=6210 RepID=A0A068WUP6_ECHGR|nr:hypothetical protein EgrG_000171100 [Echinococcus granulosus]